MKFLLFHIFCHNCNAKVKNIHNYTKGAKLAVQTLCENRHIFKWMSQPLSDKRLVGNILMGRYPVYYLIK